MHIGMRSAFRAILAITFLASGLHAQSVETQLTPSPTVALDAGLGAPLFNVSSMKIVSGDWAIKPVYEIRDNGVRVRGLLVSARPGTLVGENFGAVWYERPDEDCDEWAAKTWTEIGDAVASLKQAYAISSFQDDFWEVETVAAEAPAQGSSYVQGFAVGDPLGIAVNSLDPQTRNQAVGLLKETGYSVADVPFEKGDPAALKGWLVNAARFFDGAIGQNLVGDALRENVAARYTPPFPLIFDPTCELMQLCQFFFCRHPTECTPETIYGEWQPDGEACDCHTFGPWSAVCGRFTANAAGEVEVPIPYPPPLGSKIKLSAGLSVYLDVCVCVWERRCVADSQRTVTDIASDCSRTITTEHGPRMAFSEYDWQIAYPADQCQHAPPPVHTPPDSQPCGLRNP